MAEMAKQRSPNFSMQENSLLAQLMGEEYEDTGLSRHKYNIHRFISRSAPFQSKYDIITESVMAVVGKESAAVQGVAPFTLDTTFIQLTDTSQATTVEPPSPAQPQQCDNRAVKRRLDTNAEHAVSAVKPATTCCSHCSLNELNVLKKRKMELQIRLYKAQLAHMGEE
ncbi:hypothetical protein DPMN_147275 [Dreissena polymorpha]|uniref:Uncharacterized protein n=1 Tax=Dreissena polymorpha TaxID=45954 RepID=A0A9D4F9L0_DREPO|nr:hypothetical protein DPMN_147275 [Dreissena polymorpha]